MRQRFHKFRASTLDDAYLAMRQSLGDEAIVVRTATVPDGGWLGRVLGQKSVELTASVTVDDDPLCPDSAADASIRPQAHKLPVPEISVEVVRMRSTMAWLVALGLRDQSRPASAATCGDAIDVP